VRGRQIVGATECRGLLALEGAWHVKVGVGNFFLGQSIGIDQSNTFQLQFYSSVKTVGATVLGGLLALKTAWHPKETNLHCLGISRMHVDVDEIDFKKINTNFSLYEQMYLSFSPQ